MTDQTSDLRVIEDQRTVTGLQQMLLDELRASASDAQETWIGHRGATIHEVVYYLRSGDLWFAYQSLENRHWNAFGLGNPLEPGGDHSPVAEINISLRGIDRRIQGGFARDREGQSYLFHRGGIGGGTRGIGKSHFTRSTHFERTLAVDGDRSSELFVVSPLPSGKLVSYISAFVRDVERVKRIAPSAAPEVRRSLNIAERRATEFTGQRRYRIEHDVITKSDHATVVIELERVLRGAGRKTTCDQQRDLVLLNGNGRISALFEVKSNPEPYSLYTAVGQLFINRSARERAYCGLACRLVQRRSREAGGTWCSGSGLLLGREEADIPKPEARLAPPCLIAEVLAMPSDDRWAFSVSQPVWRNRR